MEGDDGLDIRDIDPELAWLSDEDAGIDYPTIHDPQHIAGLTPTLDDGGTEDEELDRELGNPEQLYRRLREDPDAGLDEGVS